MDESIASYITFFYIYSLRIEANEFVHVMKYFCGEINLPKLSQCENFDKFRSFDKNKDGRLCIEEFSVLVREILETAAASDSTK